MSSYICSPNHFNSIEWNARELFKNQTLHAYYIRKRFPNLDGSEQQRKETMRTIVDNLRRLNALAVSLQYKHHYAGKLDQEIQEQTEILLTERKTQIKILSARQLYGALKCPDYQIEIEHVTELRPLSDGEKDAMFFLKEMINALAHHIISQLPEVGQSWSID